MIQPIGIGGSREACGEAGFSLIEVMVAMVISAFALIGAMGMFEWADHGLRVGANGTRALALASSRLEAKKAVPWDSLLADDLDADGKSEIILQDDGGHADGLAGDEIYGATVEEGGIKLTWTVQIERGRSLGNAGWAVILVRAGYPAGRGKWRELRLGTLRANPRYVGAS